MVYNVHVTPIKFEIFFSHSFISFQCIPCKEKKFQKNFEQIFFNVKIKFLLPLSHISFFRFLVAKKKFDPTTSSYASFLYIFTYLLEIRQSIIPAVVIVMYISLAYVWFWERKQSFYCKFYEYVTECNPQKYTTASSGTSGGVLEKLFLLVLFCWYKIRAMYATFSTLAFV